jgi:hypothetical protein
MRRRTSQTQGERRGEEDESAYFGRLAVGEGVQKKTE